MGGRDNPRVRDDAASADVLATILQTALPRPRMRAGFSTVDDAIYDWPRSTSYTSP